MVGWELQRRKHHAFRVAPPPRVVLGGGHDAVRGLGEEDEVLGVLVALGGLLRRLGRLLQLRLQEGARVEGRVVGGVGRVAPARGVALGHEVLPELDHALLGGRAVRVGVGVEAEDEPVARLPSRQRVHRGEHGQRGEAVGVPVEGGEQVAPPKDVHCGDDEEVSVGHRRRLVEGRHHLGRVLAHRRRVEVLLADQDERVLVALAVEGGRGDYRIGLAERYGIRFGHEDCRGLLHEEDVDVAVMAVEDGQGVGVLLPVERVAHLLLQLLPLARGRDDVDNVDEDGVEDRLAEGLQRD
mmetsp:Transcript_21965/g.52057  ORF Transcript_21965/g.52057 Transcript_21965/m.52057 type:complete len:297 (-) Transcript_21965:826-1716(-)